MPLPPLRTATAYCRFFAYALALGSTAPLLSACSTDPPTRTEKTTPAKPAGATPAAAPLHVRFYLEYSGGMKGFMPRSTGATGQPTEFQTRVRGLVSEINGNPAVGEATYALTLTPRDGKVQHQPVAFNELKKVLQGDGPAPALGTEMPELLESVLSQPTAGQEVSILVSDFIYGPENRGKFSSFQEDIRDALAGASKQGLAVAVYGDTSAFRGNYFPAVKPAGGRPYRALAGDYVPYYLWVMGPPAQVAQFHERVWGAQAPAQQVFFGMEYPAPAYAVRLQPQLKPQGSALACTDGKTCHSVEAKLAAGPAEFAVGLDLAALPATQQQSAVLNAALRLDAPNTDAQLVPGSVRTLTAAERRQPALAAYSHVARVRVTKLFAADATLTLRLPAPPVPAWVAAWATSNDATPPTARTYRLDWILNGVQKAYGAAPAALFECAIHLTKKN